MINVFAPDKHGVHFPVLKGILDFFNFAIIDTCTSDYLF